MAGASDKKLMEKNRATLNKYRLILLFINVLYALYRVYFLWDTFSGWHMTGFALTTVVYAVCWCFFTASARPKYSDNKLVSAGIDLDQSGVVEYTWDILYTTIFVQLGSGFVSDWFWLFALIPPSIGFYFLWTKIIYPWISKPDPEAEPAQQPAGRNQRGSMQQRSR